MFQFAGFPSLPYSGLSPIQAGIHRLFLCGFPHSDICGSMDICSSPQLFAAYHVFHRLPVPRHPPHALCCLTNSNYSFWIIAGNKLQAVYSVCDKLPQPHQPSVAGFAWFVSCFLLIGKIQLYFPYTWMSFHYIAKYHFCYYLDILIFGIRFSRYGLDCIHQSWKTKMM